MRVFLAMLGFLFLLDNVQEKERMPWQEDQPLSWSDFKGKSQSTASYAASTSSGLSQKYTVDGQGYLVRAKITINANFYPEYSWYNPEFISENTLAHEQLHFDITELHARMLRKEIASFLFTSNSALEIKKIYRDMENKRQLMQAQYDEQTQHSLDRIQQDLWEQKIVKMLVMYQDWSS